MAISQLRSLTQGVTKHVTNRTPWLLARSSVQEAEPTFRSRALCLHLPLEFAVRINRSRCLSEQNPHPRLFSLESSSISSRIVYKLHQDRGQDRAWLEAPALSLHRLCAPVSYDAVATTVVQFYEIARDLRVTGLAPAPWSLTDPSRRLTISRNAP